MIIFWLLFNVPVNNFSVMLGRHYGYEVNNKDPEMTMLI